jgi:Reverse transcriptase (RNA-dependent DNA polymerase)/RNase H-like domain found in reverse transcriptase/Integrase zinc binding domain/Chromo (CHRromatin Organisation MOdifier) domain
MTEEIILGKKWLYKHNPEINIRTEEFKFTRCNCRKEKSYRILTIKQIKRYIRQGTQKLMIAVYKKLYKNNNDDTENVDPAITERLQRLQTIPKEYQSSKAFNEPEYIKQPKHTQFDHEIVLKSDEQPKFMPLRKMSIEELKALEEFIEENEPRGYIQKSISSAGYPILFVPKKNGKLRLCVDYRHLNSITIPDRTPLPLISETLDRIQGSQWFTVLDIISAYYRLRIKEGDEWKTAFRTRKGSYEWLVMPMGLTNAPASWQRFINHILTPYLDKDEGVVVYLDDVLIYTKTLEKHKKIVKAILDIFEQNELYVDIEKSQFHRHEVAFLGHIIGTNGIKMDPSKIEAVKNWPTPTNLKQVQAFNGFCNYYRRFIQGYAGIATPLYELTKKNKKFEWKETQETAFQELKQRIINEPILQNYDSELPAIVETDASDRAIGARLYQIREGRKHPIAFISKKFSETEVRYNTHDKELYAIVEACRQWRTYLQGSKFPIKIYTDHKNLVYFTTTKELNRRTTRWWEELAQYNLQIIHTPGRENAQADALSRRADHEATESPNNPILLQQQDFLVINRSISTIQKQIQKEWKEDIQKGYKKDTLAKSILEESNNNKKFNIRDGLIYFKERIYVPTTSIQNQLITFYHDLPLGGHQGIDTTIERIRRTYWFPKMTTKIEEYIRTCDTCCKIKTSRHKPYGLLHELPVPSYIGEQITLDWITDLPKSKDPTTGIEYDQILTIVERLGKYTWFLPWKSKWGSTEFINIFMRTIFQEIGLPAMWYGDRDTKSNSHFTKTVSSELGLKVKLSTSYHPQTDGQSERLNQVIETYLRGYINRQQNDWVKYLPYAQFTYNASINTTTGISPHKARFGRELEMFHGQYSYERLSEQGLITATMIKHVLNQLKEDIEFQNEKRRFYYNKRRQEAPNLKKGDRAYLLARNIKTKRPNKKLDFKKLGPFEILEQQKGDVYRLKLPETMKRLHDRFHISLLEPTPDQIRINKNLSEPDLDEDEDTEEYEVERILGAQYIDGELHYLVRWKGCNAEEDT